MNGFFGYLLFQILPAAVALLFTIYLSYIILNPTRLKTKMTKYKKTPKYEIYGKFYNKYFLGAWVCITLFFVSGIAYDIYRSMNTPSIFVVYFNLSFTLTLIFIGAALMSRALKGSKN
jgi:hypothetical protein